MSILFALFCAAFPCGAAEPTLLPRDDQHQLSIEKLPQRLDPISIKSDWGLHDTFELTLLLMNDSAHDWSGLTAKGDCTCAKAEIDEIPEEGVRKGDCAVATIAYTKPSAPGIKPTSIRFTIDEETVVLPVLLEWYSPVVLEKLEQIKADTWRVMGRVAKQWKIASANCLNSDAEIKSLAQQDRSFAVELVSSVKTTRTCRLQFKMESADPKKSIDQELTVSLESSAPRSLPSRLICRLNDRGTIAGDTRIFFPRSRLGPRPKLVSATLVLNDDDAHELSLSQKEISKAALKVDFQTKTNVNPDTLGEATRIRFTFDDQTQLNCPILISQE